MVIKVTSNAFKQLARIKEPNKYIKICVSSGGCSGIQWNIDHIETSQINKNDEIINEHLIVDQYSVFHLLGSVLDYNSSLKAAEFTLNNPNANHSCGCGKSFSIK